MRGLPGSGKSHKAARYYQAFAADYPRQQIIHSTDSYFYRDGVYRFDPARLPENHARNLSAFIQAMQRRLPLVICDNTNVCHWEYLAYQSAAEALDYEVSLQLVGEPKQPQHQLLCFERNQHGVSLAQIQQMGKAFEI